ncbi:MAG: hypothetical protein QM673_11705 [Gordonia sp. (in: high G+C Gram-positive bacteria)]
MARQQPTAQAIIEGFLLRARRIRSHSLIREQGELMSQLYSGTMKVAITRNTTTGEESHRIRMEFPPEEAMESLATRVRPLILSSEPIYCQKVLDSLVEIVGADTLDKQIDLDGWREKWRTAIDGNGEAQAYIVGTESGSITDRKLMYAWIYGDLVHATAPRSPVIQDLSIDDRYHAAAPGIARICQLVITTQIMLLDLIEKGLLRIDEAVLSEKVVVTETHVDKAAQVYVASVEGGPPGMPTDLSKEPDPTRWSSPHQALTDAGLIEATEINNSSATGGQAAESEPESTA